jgi:hypothetical protein
VEIRKELNTAVAVHQHVVNDDEIRRSTPFEALDEGALPRRSSRVESFLREPLGGVEELTDVAGCRKANTFQVIVEVEVRVVCPRGWADRQDRFDDTLSESGVSLQSGVVQS